MKNSSSHPRVSLFYFVLEMINPHPASNPIKHTARMDRDVLLRDDLDDFLSEHPAR